MAAERILVESGDESALSIRAIAAAVGVTPPSIYLHFADRTDLVFAVCERQAAQLQNAMEEAAAAVVDPWERILRRGYAYLQWGLANPEHYRILMMGRPDATPERWMDQRLADNTGLEAVADDLRAGMAAGTIAAVDPMREAELLWMVVHGLASLLIAKPDYPFAAPEAVYSSMLELVRQGLAPRP